MSQSWTIDNNRLKPRRSVIDGQRESKCPDTMDPATASPQDVEIRSGIYVKVYAPHILRSLDREHGEESKIPGQLHLSV